MTLFHRVIAKILANSPSVLAIKIAKRIGFAKILAILPSVLAIFQQFPLRHFHSTADRGQKLVDRFSARRIAKKTGQIPGIFKMSGFSPGESRKNLSKFLTDIIREASAAA